MRNKQLWKRAKAQGGFTLVELIVVIAILGILSGVGAVSYNGYVQKANQAADEQLLGVVNAAFASACLENNKDALAVSANDLKVGEGGIGSYPTGDDSINNAFIRYLADSAASPWKYYCLLNYDSSTGTYYGSDWKFKINSDGSYSIAKNGKTITISAEDRNTYLASKSFGSIGIDAVASGVDDLVAAASQVLSSETAQQAAIDIKKWDGMSDLATNLGLDINELDNNQLASLLVLYTAQSLSNTDVESQVDWLDVKETGAPPIFVPDGAGMSSTSSIAALNYALAMAYANSDYGKSDEISVDGTTMTSYEYFNKVNAELSTMEGMDAVIAASYMIQDMSDFGGNDSYWQYCQDGDCQKDFNAFMSAMSAINSNINNIDGETYVNEGMSGEYMSEVLNLLLGG